MDLSRRQFLLASAAALQTASLRPNILFLLSDDQRADALGAAGNSVIRTPHLDALAARGTLFTNHFVSTAICVSSRASILSGLHMRSHGIDQFNKQFTPQQFSRTYPGLLRAAGYSTGFIGKYGLDGGELPEKEFDFWRGFRGQGSYFPQGEPGPHLTAIMGDQAVEFLRAADASRPFCLSVSFKSPHVQDADPRQFLYDPADAALYRDVTFPYPRNTESLNDLPVSIQRSEARRRWAVRFSTPALYQESVRSYLRLITGMDRAIGRIFAELKSRNLEQNTLVVFTSDNGFYLAEHGLAGKWYMHEESIRVPLIMAGPGIAAGARRTDMTLNIDLAPTLLGFAGVTAPPSIQGRNLLQPHLRPREDWFYEHTFRSNGWIPATTGVRTTRWKYTLYPDEPTRFETLHDLQSDPGEIKNLASSRADLMMRLRRRHSVWQQALDAWRPDATWSDPD